MAFDCFLKLKDIEGEAQDSKHKGQIEVSSFSWGVTNAGTFSHGSGGGSGKATFHDLSVTAVVNKAAPKLMLACATGQHIPEAVLTCREAGGDQQDYYTIKLTDVLVSSYQASGAGHGGEKPLDSFSLNFSKVEFEVQVQKADGSLEKGAKTTYDIKQQKKS